MDNDPEQLIKIIKRLRELTYEQRQDVLEMIKDWPEGKSREFKRLQTSAEVDVLIEDRVIQTHAKDVSAGGIFINAQGNFKTDKDVRIVFTVPGHNKPFKLKGTIIRVQEDGIAIQFNETSPFFKDFLDQTIWKEDEID